MHAVPTAFAFDVAGGLFALIVVLAGVATVVFIAVQAWMESPQRREFNKAWFAQFETHMRECYSNGELSWRILDMKSHFDHSLH